MIDIRPVSIRRARLGFTLVELLTVIAIIAILMGILIPTIGAVKQTAKKTQAKSDAIMIVNAVKAFYTEYGRYPVPEGSSATGDLSFLTAEDNKKIMDVLRAEEAGTNPVNFRKKVFMEGTVAKKDGRYGIQSDGTFLDPWDVVYKIVIDTDYDEKILGGDYGDVHTGVIVYTFGKDNTKATTIKGSDDVVSWQ